uniref:Dihydrofolate reductase n=1 Tax=Burkholderia phage vB_BgluM-SURPRISE13 TaxID=3159457 RepID=A0AAU7PGN0_9VIRU
MDITAIVLMGHHRTIGQTDQKPPFVAEHARLVKAYTEGKPVLMGRKTFELMGGGIDGSMTYVLTQNPEWRAEGAIPVLDFAAFIKEAFHDGIFDEVVIFGGAQTFAEAWPWCNKLVMTKFPEAIPGYKKFPLFPSHWTPGYIDNHYQCGEHEVQQLSYRRDDFYPFPSETPEEKAIVFAINFARQYRNRQPLHTGVPYVRNYVKSSESDHQADGSV